jgi:lipopolysaccharide transport system ATP-binding protein
MSDIAIRAEGLSKQFRIGRAERYRTLRDTLAGAFTAPFRDVRSGTGNCDRETIWAVKDVSFEVKHGEVVGIIGRNGAGKSTLLKILSRITEPTKGYAEIYGHVGSLLEVGTGFHPELTGRENIFLNGAILGMKKAEILRKFDEIVAFAEVEKFIDTPVKHYSSGMYVRLAFAVAAHLQAEILVIDEVLSVGDAAFQQKCLRKMHDAATGGRTILFVSHNMPAVLNICNRGILMSNGAVEIDSGSERAVGAYLKGVGETAVNSLAERTDRRGNGRLRFKSFRLCDSNLNLVPCARSGNGAVLAFEYESAAALSQVHVAVGMHGIYDEHLFLLATNTVQSDFPRLPPRGEVLCKVPAMPLQPGSYGFNLFCSVGGDIADWIQYAGRIEVEGDDFFGTGRLPPVEQGPFLVEHAWSYRDR